MKCHQVCHQRKAFTQFMYDVDGKRKFINFRVNSNRNGSLPSSSQEVEMMEMKEVSLSDNTNVVTREG